MKALNWFPTERQTTGPVRLCLMVLCDMANEEGICWPSHRELAYRCNVAEERSIRRYLRELERLGLTEILQNRQGRLHGYRLPGPLDRTDRVASPDSSCTLTGQIVSADRTDCVSPYSRTQEPNEPIESTAPPPPSIEVELPDRFPKTPAIGVQWALGAYPAEWVTDEWHLAASRGGRDQKDCLIRSWPSYLAIRWKWEQGSGRKNGAPKNGQLSPGMTLMRIAELEKRIDAHAANPLNGHTPMDTQREDYRRLKLELSKLQAA